jgi:hypothetical protein
MATLHATFLEAYRRLDPAQPLADHLLDSYHVPRPGDPVARLAFDLAQSNRPLRALLAGQRGVGKTTELHRLQRLIARGAVWFLDIGHGLRSETTDTIIDHITAALRKAANIEEGLGPGLERTVQALARQQAISPILLLDGLERLARPESLYSLLRELASVECSLVLVTDLSMAMGKEYDTHRETWQRIVLAAVPIFLPDRSGPDEFGWKSLKAVVERRLHGLDAPIHPSAFRQLIQASGGVLRDFVRVTGAACFRVASSKEPNLMEDVAKAAVQDMRTDLVYDLEIQDRNHLKKFMEERGDASLRAGEREHLKRNLVIVYQGENPWQDVHSLLWPLLGPLYPKAPYEFR